MVVLLGQRRRHTNLVPRGGELPYELTVVVFWTDIIAICTIPMVDRDGFQTAATAGPNIPQQDEAAGREGDEGRIETEDARPGVGGIPLC
jgi:hypothetical protein